MADTAIKQSSEDIVHALGKEAKSAAFIMAQTPTDKINAALKTLARALRENVASLLEANRKNTNARVTTESCMGGKCRLSARIDVPPA